MIFECLLCSHFLNCDVCDFSSVKCFKVTMEKCSFASEDADLAKSALRALLRACEKRTQFLDCNRLRCSNPSAFNLA